MEGASGDDGGDFLELSSAMMARANSHCGPRYAVSGQYGCNNLIDKNNLL